MNTPNVGIPYVTQGTLDPAAGLNLALNVIDALLQCAVIELGRNTPPVSPADGDMYIVGVGTGAWAGQDDNLARYVADGAFWQFYTAGIQVRLIVNLDDSGIYSYNSSSASAGWELAGGLPDAPSDAQLYARRDGAWEAFAVTGATTAPVVNTASANIDADETNSGNYTRFSHASPTYTFDDAEAFVVGDEYHGRYVGSGTLVITEAGTMTINPPADGTLEIPIGGTFTVKIVASNEADLFGVTVPAS
jgi:hypothetical protein